ncbi:MAG: DsbA family oxidoreductase [Alphaproteobacteria bacterium]
MTDNTQKLDGPAAVKSIAAFHVDIISDVMCPWCYIGKRRFERLAALRPDFSFQISWRPFQLDPTLPPEGLDRSLYLTRKFGDAQGIEAVYDPIRAAGIAENIAFDFDAIATSPNTLGAHRLIAWAHDAGTADQIVEALFISFFIEGRDIGNNEVLAEIAKGCGMDGARVLARLSSDEDLEKTRQAADQAREMGVSGVPTYIIDKHYVVEGAQSPENLASAFDRIAQSYSAA